MQEKNFLIVSKVIYFLDFNKQQNGKGLNILTPKKMLQRLPIALTKVKAGNTSENILNEFLQIIFSLYQAKQITKKVYKIIMNLLKL